VRLSLSRKFEHEVFLETFASNQLAR
jgi:hypothetical protein